MFAPSRSGFSTTELIIIVVIVGVLSAVALPKFAATRAAARDQGPQHTLIEALLDYQGAQRAHWEENGTFAESPAVLGVAMPEGVSVAETRSTSATWSLSLTHDDGVLCSMSWAPEHDLGLFCTGTSRPVQTAP